MKTEVYQKKNPKTGMYTKIQKRGDKSKIKGNKKTPYKNVKIK